jgi:hypothetical protein
MENFKFIEAKELNLLSSNYQNKATAPKAAR